MVQFLSNEEARQGLVPLIIGGKDTQGSNIFVVKNPDGKAVWEATGASVNDAVKAVEAAEAALPAWAATKPAARRDIFLRAADIFSQRYEEFVRIQVDETGADPVFVNWILKLTIDNLKEVAGKCSLVQGTIPTCGEEGRAALVLREPYGVILGIAPWYV
jgi:acyl-CoA reductase-like NAD-dependent aldehyde dehydrogenase